VDGRESGQWREADLIVASWYQHTSRDGDMQLHTHNQVAHVAITRDDGKGRAPDSTAYYEHARASGQIASVHAEARPHTTVRDELGGAGRRHGLRDRRHRR
jgi:TrwC relaxase